MFKKILLSALITVALAACGPDQYQRQAQQTAQHAQQSQYSTLAQCQAYFNRPNDCYRGTNGMFFSPLWYPWGAVYHRDNSVSYGNSVPSTGGRWVQNPRSSSVDFSRSSSFVSSRASTTRSAYYSSSASRGGFGSSARSGGFSSGGG